MPSREHQTRGLLEDVDGAGGAEPDDVREADLGALDLTVARLAAQVRRHLEDVGDTRRTDRVTLRDQAAADVDRDLAVAPRAALVDELAGLARRAELQVVVVDQLGGREAVVQLDEVEILRVDARRLVRLLAPRCG